MFRPMRRSKQQLPENEALAIVKNNTHGVLALQGDEDYPYAVPMSYVYAEGKLYFHAALEGHKIDAVHRSEKCSFCIVDQDEVIPLEYTTYFRSVIAFGRIHTVEDQEEWLHAIRLIANRYAPSHPQGPDQEIAGAKGRMHILRMDIEHLTGKEAVELMRRHSTHSNH